MATRDLEEGEVVLVSEAALSMVLPTHKKRVCAFCHSDTRRRLTLHCSESQSCCSITGTASLALEEILEAAGCGVCMSEQAALELTCPPLGSAAPTLQADATRRTTALQLVRRRT